MFNSWAVHRRSGHGGRDRRDLKASLQRLSAARTKSRLHDWAYLALADLEANRMARTGLGYGRGACLCGVTLPMARWPFSPPGAPLAPPLRRWWVEGHRWAVEDGFETAKNELGLDHNETRSWNGWHRHVSLVMLAFAMLAAIRHRLNAETMTAEQPETVPSARPRPVRGRHRWDRGLVRWSVQEIRRVAVRLNQQPIQPAHIIAWSLWRRAHQAAARTSHLKKKMQL